jgi:hypothetical protein
MASSFGIQAPKAPQKPRVGRIAMNRGLALEGYAPSYLHPLFGVACNAFGRQAERTLNHSPTTIPRRSCKQLPSRFPPVAR